MFERIGSDDGIVKEFEIELRPERVVELPLLARGLRCSTTLETYSEHCRFIATVSWERSWSRLNKNTVKHCCQSSCDDAIRDLHDGGTVVSITAIR